MNTRLVVRLLDSTYRLTAFIHEAYGFHEREQSSMNQATSPAVARDLHKGNYPPSLAMYRVVEMLLASRMQADEDGDGPLGEMTAEFKETTKRARELLCPEKACLSEAEGKALDLYDILREICSLREDSTYNEFVVTGPRQKIYNTMAVAVVCGLPVLLQGPPGVGKTASVASIYNFYKDVIF